MRMACMQGEQLSLPPQWSGRGPIEAGISVDEPPRMRRTTSQAAADAAAAILVAASGRVSSSRWNPLSTANTCSIVQGA